MNKPATPKLQNLPKLRPRGRSEKVSEAVQAAVIQVLLDRGAAKLTIEAVAEIAGVNRTTVYRRWASKERMITWALLETMKLEVPQPDFGNIEKDLFALAESLHAFLKTPLASAIAQVSVPGPGADELVRDTVQSFWDGRMELSYEIIDRAIGRGELPANVDKREAMELIFGPFYFRQLTGQGTIDTAYLKKLVSRALAMVIRDTETV